LAASSRGGLLAEPAKTEISLSAEVVDVTAVEVAAVTEADPVKVAAVLWQPKVKPANRTIAKSGTIILKMFFNSISIIMSFLKCPDDYAHLRNINRSVPFHSPFPIPGSSAVSRTAVDPDKIGIPTVYHRFLFR
jgi:hypothetical protein